LQWYACDDTEHQEGAATMPIAEWFEFVRRRIVEEPMTDAEKKRRSFLDILSELGALIDASAEPKLWAVFALGSVTGMCLRAGWKLEEIPRIEVK
jgi:hypothetical protein